MEIFHTKFEEWNVVYMNCPVFKVFLKNSFLFLTSQKDLDEGAVKMNEMCILDVLDKKELSKRMCQGLREVPSGSPLW